VSTASTKLRSHKKKRKVEVASSKTLAEPSAPRGFRQGDVSQRTWLICSLSILAVAAFLRLYHLDLVPFHHDEGVNGNFLVRLVRDGFYQYDPANYHGPTLYYFSTIIPWTLRYLFGTSAQNTYGLHTVTVRLVPALFGLATVWLVLLLRRRLGTIGALSAAALLAVSPGAVYLSRYYIHETLFVFFTLGLVVAGLRYYEDGHSVYLILAAVSAALLFATKETAMISAGVLLIALLSTHVYRWLRRRAAGGGQKRSRSSPRQNGTDQTPDGLQRYGGVRMLAIWATVAIGLFIALNVVLYSSFFTNYPKGVYDALKTFDFWTKTGKAAHVHPFETYIWWLFYQESPVLVLGTIGAAFVVWKPRNSFALFSALWAFGILAAYSLIPYKTPWLALNFIVPLALIAGYALEVIYDPGRRPQWLIVGIMVVAIGISGYQTVDLNFFNYDNDAQYYVYVYAHTRRETLKLVDEIDRIASRTGQGKQLGITIVSTDYWPLPWYLRDYGRVGYFGHMSTSNEPVIIASEGQGAEMEATFGARYQQVSSGFNAAGSYALRPGVNLLLYVQRDSLRTTSESASH
jgi:uncharacterized protein (TIGR03663 family)